MVSHGFGALGYVSLGVSTPSQQLGQDHHVTLLEMTHVMAERVYGSCHSLLGET